MMNENQNEYNHPDPLFYPAVPEEPIYEGSNGLATASLILGILALLSMCCMPPLSLLFGGLGLILAVLSKGSRTRPVNAKAGMVLSSISIAIVALLIAVILFTFLANPKGKNFLQEYMHILTNPEEYTGEDIYDFIYDYMYPDGEENTLPFDGYDDDDHYDYGPYHDDDNFGNFYDIPEIAPNDNVI